MTHTTFRFDKECPCYGCILIPVCRNKFSNQLLKNCALIRDLLMTIYRNIQGDEDNITNITVEIVPIDIKIAFHKSALLYWSHYSTEEKS